MIAFFFVMENGSHNTKFLLQEFFIIEILILISRAKFSQKGSSCDDMVIDDLESD